MINKVLIIGGSGGIGVEIIKTLLSSNHFVINLDIKSVSFSSSNYDEFICDLTQVNIEKTFYEVIKKHNYIDAFISAIGYYGVKKIEEFSTEEYYKTLNINLNIPTFFTIKAIREMQQLGRGKIILLSSAAAYVGSRDIPYSISKSALSGLIRGVCNNLKNANIYVYGIAPGIVETNMSDNMDFSRQKDTIDRTINKRKCQPTEIANLVKFLLEEEKGYMNGSIIHINNGLYFN